MNVLYDRRLQGILAAVGAIIWISCGIILSLRPAGNPPVTFRATVDLMPYLAVGLLAIGISVGSLMLTHGRHKRLLYIACLMVVWGSISYALGRIIRNAFLNGVGWEPFMPFGFLAVALGMSLMGIAALRLRVLSKTTDFLLIAMGICLLTFNDQLIPWVAVPFGLCVLAFVYLLVFKERYERNYTEGA